MNSGEKKFEKKMKILETAYNLFKTKSVASTAIDDVVKAAGIARGTFYLYFKDKSDLLEQIILFKSTESMKQLINETEEKIETGGLELSEITVLFINMYIDFLQEHRDVLAVVTKNLSSCLKMFPESYDKEAQELYEKIVGRFSSAGIPEEKINKIVYIIVDMVGSVCSDAILYARPFSLEQIRPIVTDAALSIIKGELPQKGEAII